LVESITKNNVDNIKTYISVPAQDLFLFKNALAPFDVNVITDQEIISANSKIDLKHFENTPGNLQQQIVKSEFWRLNLSKSYVCLDSDAKFIKPFYRSDFIYKDDLPYTIMDEGQEFLEFVLTSPKRKIFDDFHKGGKIYQEIFNRPGKTYSFGPMPVIWHREVWQSLEINYLDKRGINFHQAIMEFPSEIPWYGEALLAYQAIPLIPSQPLFKVYHYAHQYDADVRKGWTEKLLSKIYLGVIYQSSWQREQDWPHELGSTGSKLVRRLKRLLHRT
jgi:hypothetical protein